MVWRPAIVPTVGVKFLPGFKDGEANVQKISKSKRKHTTSDADGAQLELEPEEDLSRMCLSVSDGNDPDGDPQWSCINLSVAQLEAMLAVARSWGIETE